MPKNWNGPLGPVTLKDFRGVHTAFANIALAAANIRYHRLQMSEHPLPGRETDFFVFSRDHNLMDDCGLIIPIWRIAREIEALGPWPQPYWYNRHRDYDPDRDFRQRPLAGSGRRWRYGRCLRLMKTRQELREHFGLEADMRDLEDFPVRVKLRAKRKSLPTLWDDVPNSRRGDGWKNYRKSQEKGRCGLAGSSAQR